VILLLLVSVGGLVVIITVGNGGETSVETVPPRLLSKPEPVRIDARTNQTNTDDWRLADLESGTRLTSVVATDAGFAAAGVDIGGPGIWTSDNGSGWELAGRLEQPPGVSAGAWQPMLLGEWQGSLLTYAWVEGQGTAVWLDTRFGGYVAGPDASLTSKIVPGERLIAATLMSVDGSPVAGLEQDQASLVVSENGADWSEVSRVGVTDADVLQMIGFAGGDFFAMATCETRDCPAWGLYRSADGLEWRPASIESADSGNVFVTDVAAIGDALVAVGTAGNELFGRPAVWSSTEGEHWSLDDLDDIFQPETTTVELIAVDLEDTPESATVAVDGTPFHLTEDSVIETDVGSITVSAVNSDSVRLTIGTGRSSLLDIHEQTSMERVAFLQEVASSGERVAIRGFRVARAGGDAGTFLPAIWLSEDGGATWTEKTIESGEGAWIASMAISDTGMVVIGGSGEGSERTWYYDPVED